MPKAQRPTPHPLAEAIYAAWKDGKRGRSGSEEPHRWHLGGSMLGKECDRYLWYVFRWVQRPDFPGRLLRLFDRGDLEEPRIVDDLRAIGAQVEEIDPETDQQWRHRWHGGHLAQSIDGKAWNLLGCHPDETLVAEFKTAKESIWTQLAANGVAVTQPHYYAQCQLGMQGTGLSKCLFVSVNKDTDEIHVEIVEYDEAEAERLLSRGRRIVDAPVPPAGISERPSFYKCKYCDVREVCHFGQVPEVNCRTCAHATPVQTGETGDWSCALIERQGSDSTIPEHVMRAGCECHVFLPDLVPARAVDADPDGSWVEYEATDGSGTFRNGAGGLTSADIRSMLS